MRDGGDARALIAAVGAILAEADAEIAAHRPRCEASGRCCRFEEYGHRLYVTGVELVYFWSMVEGADAPIPAAPPAASSGPGGAADCSHGWSGGAAQPADAEPVGNSPIPHVPPQRGGGSEAAQQVAEASVVSQRPLAPARGGAGLGGGPRRVSLPQFFAGERVEGCPYQVDKLCTAREGRPLGCRVYFCDPGAQAWQNELYERYHARLKAVHERFGVAYEYVEWRAGLKKMMDGS